MKQITQVFGYDIREINREIAELNVVQVIEWKFITNGYQATLLIESEHKDE